jgi:hypothetical protein
MQRICHNQLYQPVRSRIGDSKPVPGAGHRQMNSSGPLGASRVHQSTQARTDGTAASLSLGERRWLSRGWWSGLSEAHRLLLSAGLGMITSQMDPGAAGSLSVPDGVMYVTHGDRRR